MLVTHGHIADVYRTTVTTCEDRGDCDTVVNSFMNLSSWLRDWGGILVVVLPGVAGVFWGAPLVAREVEAGTFRMIWTQSVTRRRWLASRVAVVGLSIVAASAVLVLLFGWWAGLQDKVGTDLYGTFDQRDLVPVAHALFGFALGVAIGTLVRRVLPAMALTMVVFVTVRLVVSKAARPHFMTPSKLEGALEVGRTGFGSENGGPMSLRPDPPRLPNAWPMSVDIVDKAGRALTPSVVETTCPQMSNLPKPGEGGGPRQAPKGVMDALEACVTDVGKTYHTVVTYHPKAHYWPLQWIESGGYTALAALLLGWCAWKVRRIS
jgi:hypothetical protein